ncbi:MULTISPECIES: D-alanine--D-alanine ligase family protein [unclassified Candidatus Frackibacter]|uniref:D-alanine--D-alanine ligase family protein n=1 Tax=unclassified Candidatus Frackibacter TaxID=2648818 RepID=UPI000793088B|nr:MULTISPECIES: D-alanine--D-alanine ligase [unclassified Candidatus Frackibacter]KXS42463.1 MAG: D-alanine-D-alanine ligase [Candidatus Frackibacter sp. T328-2]SDC34992.1 D-alanine-D-alanine ligase [Candidatus Frackibacter sp. WG11]SEM56424.1 D-alanine-D-alanine ligase [Candidatus Frackibacter sp. WG12]SFL70884.1 D-alanine-D-alanine ligase [Candidatus Frackibacter sp. WG13]
MDKRAAVICGGKSAERKISLKTGQAIYDALKGQGVDVIKLDPQNDEFYKNLITAEADVAFIALHGRYGEDGTIQGLLEMEGIPYTGSGVLASAMAINKIISKKIFRQEGILTPKFKVLNKGEWESGSKVSIKKLIDKFGLPIVVKPVLEGSSLGLSIVKKEEDLITAINEAFKYDTEVLIEEYIDGKEITVGILGNDEPIVLPIIEIKPKDGVYNFEAKYTKGMTEFIIPAQLKDSLYNQARKMSYRAYQALKCSGMARVDLMVAEDDKPYVLEVNTIPGMTETSLLPQAAQAADISFEELVIKILEYALE